MKKFKTFDAWFSIILIVAFTIYSFVKLDYTFLIGYCVVGSWQMISIIIHALNGWFTFRKAGRFNYHFIVAVLATLTLIGFVAYPVLWAVMVLLLFAAPFMAIYYTWLCYDEVYVKMQRPMAALK